MVSVAPPPLPLHILQKKAKRNSLNQNAKRKKEKLQKRREYRKCKNHETLSIKT
jgi:hypothetical protein